MNIQSIKCDACPRVCPEVYGELMAKFTAACKERDELKKQVIAMKLENNPTLYNELHKLEVL